MAQLHLQNINTYVKVTVMEYFCTSLDEFEIHATTFLSQIKIMHII